MNMIVGLPTRVTVLVPVFQEEATVTACYDAIRAVFATLPDYDYEIVFTDNHSSDGTFAILAAIAAADPKVRVIRFSRNNGYQHSLLVGYRSATGDCAVQMDCDLQDPPELIPRMLELWRQGHHVVYGVRRTLRDGAATRLARRGFYRLVARLSEDDLPVDAGEFRLVDRRILRELKEVRDTSPYVRGLISAMGFSQIGIAYDRGERTAGESKFPLRHMVALALDGLLNHSLLPLRIASMTGMIVGCVTFLLTFVYMILRLTFGRAWPAGFATTTLLLLMSITLNSIFLGIIGEYLGRIFMQAKGRPMPVIETVLNAPAVRGARDAPADEAARF